MSLVNEILSGLWNTSLSYKGMRVNLFGVPNSSKYKESSLRTTLIRMGKKKLIKSKNRDWYITSSYGKKYLEKEVTGLKQFESPFEVKSIKNLILMFDIPESRKPEREWLRWHLKKFKYIMIQKSVWVGPSPLPKDFKKYLEEIEIKNNIKTFKLARNYNTK